MKLTVFIALISTLSVINASLERRQAELSKPAIPACDSILSNAVNTKFIDCGVAAGTSLLPESDAWRTFNTNQCVDPKCYNYEAGVASLLQGTCPILYVGNATTSFNIKFPPVPVSLFLSAKIRTQAEVDADYKCVKDGTTLCYVDFYAAVTTKTPAKDKLCTPCTTKVFAAFDSNKVTTFTDVVEDLEGKRSIVSSVCGADFLKTSPASGTTTASSGTTTSAASPAASANPSPATSPSSASNTSPSPPPKSSGSKIEKTAALVIACFAFLFALN